MTLNGQPEQIRIRVHHCHDCGEKWFQLATPNHCPECGSNNLLSFSTIHNYQLVKENVTTKEEGDIHSQ
jgi:rRNA maturation endonuclease Nob1